MVEHMDPSMDVGTRRCTLIQSRSLNQALTASVVETIRGTYGARYSFHHTNCTPLPAGGHARRAQQSGVHTLLATRRIEPNKSRIQRSRAPTPEKRNASCSSACSSSEAISSCATRILPRNTRGNSSSRPSR